MTESKEGERGGGGGGREQRNSVSGACHRHDYK